MQPARLEALVETATLEAVFIAAAWLLQPPSGYGWLSKAFMAILALAAIYAHGSPERYGLKPRSPRFSAKWAALTLALFAAFYVAALLAAAAVGVAPRLEPRSLLLDLAWYYVFVGLVEELFFRGYVQSRLNEAFTKRYKSFLGVNFEWTQGTLVAAVFYFGLPHLLTGVNPFAGRFEVDAATVAITVFAAFLGLVYGVIREKTGSIIVPAALHGSVDFTAFTLADQLGFAAANAVTATALFVFFALYLERILTEPVE